MPNHCYNHLTIEGDNDELKRFKEFAQGPHPGDEGQDIRVEDGSMKRLPPEIEPLCCDKFITMPEEILKKDGAWYEWCIKNWGTKWGCYETIVSSSDGVLQYDFQSAWAPPCIVVTEMGRLFPALRFHHYYEEPGCDFEGDLIIENGQVVTDDCRKYTQQCDSCGEKTATCVYDDVEGEYYCDNCREKKNLPRS
jgi:hypothetical protein